MAEEKESLAIVPSAASAARVSSSGATGPRTLAGKQRSKYNAQKHGIFSKVAVIAGESQKAFKALLDGLRDDFQPVGTMENVLVEKLALLIWQSRRLASAENAEVLRSQAAIVPERENAERLGSIEMCRAGREHFGGLISLPHSQSALRLSLDYLKYLQAMIGKRGLLPDIDTIILTAAYGYPNKKPRTDRNLHEDYLDLHAHSIATPEERTQKSLLSPEQCKSRFLERLDAEIKRLEACRNTQMQVVLNHVETESCRRSIPDSSALDRFLKYNARIERDIDRTLSRLERLQRMRRGQAVPPPIQVNLSSN
jgi:hypothetical protein